MKERHLLVAGRTAGTLCRGFDGYMTCVIGLRVSCVAYVVATVELGTIFFLFLSTILFMVQHSKRSPDCMKMNKTRG